MNMWRNTTKFNFTIVELLVVVGVIAILAGLLLPAFTKAKGSGNRAQCINNLSQIGKALEMYAQDHDGYFPGGCTSQKLTDAARIPVQGLLSAYLRNNDLYKCPDEREGLFETEGSSYIWNWLQIDLPGNERSGQSKYSVVPFGEATASSFPVMIDAGAYHGKSGEKRSMNVLFADWSVNTAGEIKFL
jgi:prepilin-type processing-associated H-X9-DG protein